MSGTVESDLVRTVEETLAALALRRDGDRWTGSMPANIWGPVVFGGFVIAHAVAAAARDAPDGRRLKSLHAHFLRPVRGGEAISYRTTPLSDGRTLTVNRLDAHQGGEHMLTLTCSFGADTESYEYQPALPDGVPGPGGLPTRSAGPFVMVPLGPTQPGADGTMTSTHRMWFRTVAPLPDDTGIAAAITSFATDFTYTGARPLHLEGDTRGIVSLDHSLWFHRELRPDAWSYYDVASLVNTGGRGLLRGQMYDGEGRLCVTCLQETLLRRYEDSTPRHREGPGSR